MLVSADVHGTQMVDTLLLRHTNAPLARPQPGLAPPHPRHARWHRRQVFRGPARAGA